MFDSLFEGFKYMDEGTKQGLIFAAGMGLYYICRRLFKPTNEEIKKTKKSKKHRKAR